MPDYSSAGSDCRQSGTIKAIVFDLGRVMIDFNHRIAVDRIRSFTDKDAAETFNLFFDSELTALFEEDKLTPQEFFSEIKKRLDLKLDYERFVLIWNDIFFLTDKNRGVYELARSLKPQYSLALLTNTNLLHFEYIRNTFPILDVFDTIITSFEVKAQKPKPAIYQRALQMLRLSAPEVFYTDDRPELVESARAMGINGFVFTGVEQLKRDLVSQGIRIAHNL